MLTTLVTFATKVKFAAIDHKAQILTGVSITTSVAACSMAVYASVKKLPAIQAEFDAAINSIEQDITVPYVAAREELDAYPDDALEALLTDANETGDTDIATAQIRVNNLITLCQNGPQLEAASVTKARLVRAGKIAWAFLPSFLLLSASIVSNVFMLKTTLRAAAIAGATITALTSELAATRKQLSETGGAKALAEFDHAQTIAEVEGSSDEKDEEIGDHKHEVLNKNLYTRIYDDHLVRGADPEACLKMAMSDLSHLERLWTDKLHRIGRVYYGDVLRALGYDTDHCGQNTGWITRDYPNDYDGYVDFGCWTMVNHPETGLPVRIFNPDAISEDGTILLNFNVEGDITDLLKEAKIAEAQFRKANKSGNVLPES